ncbi:MAG: DMT family transporter [Planctomycetales bacterium]|nr:DMT family transporter [Planctomycetales bacterium]
MTASFLAQFFGNAAFQKALEHIGLAASVPITLGVLIVGGAVLGAVLLKEPVGARKMLAMATLILAVIVLSLPHQMPPGDSPNAAAIKSADAANIVIGSLWAALSGLAYSFFGVTLRQTLQTGIPARNLMFISGLTGTITLWGYCFATLGLQTISGTSPTQWAIMVTAGFCNFSAFVAITTALRLLPVVAVNLINASQVAMAAVAGVAFFGEPITAPLFIGIMLTLAGLMILARRTRAPIVITD